MTRFYSIDEATAALPEVERILLALRDQRADLIRLRDRIAAGSATGSTGPEGAGSGEAPGTDVPTPAEAARIRLAMQGLIDQMQAGVADLVRGDITLRDIEAGLIDFPALVAGRQVWLCWRLGDGPAIEWWHELTSGFSGRRRLADLA